MSVAPDAGIKALTLAQQLSKEDKLITAKPGERIFRRGAGGALEMVAEIPDDEDPLKAASRDKFREIYSRYPDTPEGRAQAAVEFRNWDNKFKENVSAAGRLTFDTPKDRFAAITEVNNQVKPFVTQINTLDQAIALRIKDKSPFSQAVFTQVVGSAFGDSQKAQQEILRLVNTGNLGQRVTNTLNLFLSGDIGQATKEDQLESLNAIREYAANQMDTTLTPYRMAAGEKADEVAPLSSTRFKRPVLGPGKQYIPFTVIQQYNLQKGQQFKTGGKTYIYNGDGTVSLVGEK
jgi:hypothetical protein